MKRFIIFLVGTVLVIVFDLTLTVFADTIIYNVISFLMGYFSVGIIVGYIGKRTTLAGFVMGFTAGFMGTTLWSLLNIALQESLIIAIKSLIIISIASFIYGTATGAGGVVGGHLHRRVAQPNYMGESIV